MTQFEKKLVLGVHDEALVIGLHPKIHQDFEILERLMTQAACRLRRQLEDQDERDSEEGVVEFDFEIEPELVKIAEAIMEKNDLPLEKLPNMLLLLMEEYKSWRYDDTITYIKKQILG